MTCSICNAQPVKLTVARRGKVAATSFYGCPNGHGKISCLEGGDVTGTSDVSLYKPQRIPKQRRQRESLLGQLPLPGLEQEAARHLPKE